MSAKGEKMLANEEAVPLLSDSIPLLSADELLAREGEIKAISESIDLNMLIGIDHQIQVLSADDLATLLDIFTPPVHVSTLSPQNPNDQRADGSSAYLNFQGNNIIHGRDNSPDKGFALFSPLLTRVRPSVHVVNSSSSTKPHLVEFYLTLNEGWGDSHEHIPNTACRFEIQISGVGHPEHQIFSNIAKSTNKIVNVRTDSGGFSIKLTQFDKFPEESGGGSSPNWIFHMARIWEFQQ
jgi:hypothetical protein